MPCFLYLVPVMLPAAHFPLGHDHDHNPDSNPNPSTSILPCEGGETTDSSSRSNTSYCNQLYMYPSSPNEVLLLPIGLIQEGTGHLQQKGCTSSKAKMGVPPVYRKVYLQHNWVYLQHDP